MICKSCNKSLLSESEVCCFCGMKINVDQEVKHITRESFYNTEKLKKIVYMIVLMSVCVGSYFTMNEGYSNADETEQVIPTETEISASQTTDENKVYINFVDESGIPLYPEELHIYLQEENIYYRIPKNIDGYSLATLEPDAYRFCLTYSADGKYYQSDLYEFVIDEEHKLDDENLFNTPVTVHEMEKVSRINQEQFLNLDTYDLDVYLSTTDEKFICSLPWDNEGYIYMSPKHLPAATYGFRVWVENSDFYDETGLIEFEIDEENELSLAEEIYLAELQVRIVKADSAYEDVVIRYSVGGEDIIKPLKHETKEDVRLLNLPDTTYVVSIEPVIEGVYEDIESLKFTIKNGRVIGERRLEFDLIPINQNNHGSDG